MTVLSVGVESRHAIKQERIPCRRPSDVRTEGDNWGGGPSNSAQRVEDGLCGCKRETRMTRAKADQITKRAAGVNSGVRRIGEALELSIGISAPPAQHCF